MKTFMPLLTLIIVVCLVSLAIGYFLGVHDRDAVKKVLSSKAIKAIQHQRDSAMKALKESVLREQSYILKAELDSVNTAKLEKNVAFLESKSKTYAQRLEEISKINIAHPDSFLIKRYPQ